MGAVTFGIPKDMAEMLVRSCGLTMSVETGTYLGGTAEYLRTLTPRVWTIEIDPRLHARASDRLDHLTDVTVLLGESGRVLRDIGPDVTEPCLFWLDGHGGTFGGDDLPSRVKECPILEELSAIAKYPKVGRSCILIDDARLFTAPYPRHRRDDWPALADVLDALRRDTDRFVTILDDVILAVPMDTRRTVEDWWLAKLEANGGRDAFTIASDPTPARAVRQLIRSVVPQSVRSLRRRVFDHGDFSAG